MHQRGTITHPKRVPATITPQKKKKSNQTRKTPLDEQYTLAATAHMKQTKQAKSKLQHNRANSARKNKKTRMLMYRLLPPRCGRCGFPLHRFGSIDHPGCPNDCYLPVARRPCPLYSTAVGSRQHHSTVTPQQRRGGKHRKTRRWQRSSTSIREQRGAAMTHRRGYVRRDTIVLYVENRQKSKDG